MKAMTSGFLGCLGAVLAFVFLLVLADVACSAMTRAMWS